MPVCIVLVFAAGTDYDPIDITITLSDASTFTLAVVIHEIANDDIDFAISITVMNTASTPPDLDVTIGKIHIIVRSKLKPIYHCVVIIQKPSLCRFKCH